MGYIWVLVVGAVVLAGLALAIKKLDERELMNGFERYF